jgi:hypothetical protein
MAHAHATEFRNSQLGVKTQKSTSFVSEKEERKIHLQIIAALIASVVTVKMNPQHKLFILLGISLG